VSREGKKRISPNRFLRPTDRFRQCNSTMPPDPAPQPHTRSSLNPAAAAPNPGPSRQRFTLFRYNIIYIYIYWYVYRYIYIIQLDSRNDPESCSHSGPSDTRGSLKSRSQKSDGPRYRRIQDSMGFRKPRLTRVHAAYCIPIYNIIIAIVSSYTCRKCVTRGQEHTHTHIHLAHSRTIYNNTLVRKYII